MHVLLIVIGVMFLLFGGGCTLIIGGFSLTDPVSIGKDPTAMSMLVFMGLLPLGIGWLLLRQGLKIDREKRRAKLPPQDGGQGS